MSFFEAKELLNGEGPAEEYFDAEHSDAEHSVHEDRYRTIGTVRRGVITVVWTPRGEDAIRIISARFSTRLERQRFFRKAGGQT